jgi:molybdopterin converting factor subunit 1
MKRMATLLFFGKLRDIAGPSRTIALGDETRTLDALRARLSAETPELAAALNAPTLRIAVDQGFASGDAPISDQSEIAFMPPMSGG